MQNTQKHKQFQARNTVLEMLQDRGYVIPEKEFDFTFEQFLEIGFYDLYVANEDETEWTYVHFSKHEKQLTISNLKDIYQSVLKETENLTAHVIMILNEGPNSSVKSALATPEYSMLEYFLYSDLVINITKHELMPKFRIIDDQKELKVILDRYNATKQQLPKFLTTDPVPRYYNAKSGTVFEITVKSPTVGNSVRYRVVR